MLLALATPGCFDLTFDPFQVGFTPTYTTPAVAWAKRVGGVGDELPPVIDVFGDSSFAAAGSFDSEECVFGPGEGAETTLHNASGFDGYVARYRASGALDWVQQLNTAAALEVTGVVGLPDQSVFVTGSFEHGLSVEEVKLSAVGDSDVFLAAFEADGALRWAVQTGGEHEEKARALAVSPGALPVLVVAGTFVGPSMFGEGSTAVELVDAADGSPQGLVAAYDGQGSLIWASQTFGAAEIVDVVIVGDEVVAAGSFTGETAFGANGLESLSAAGQGDVFLAGYALQDGALRWVEQIGGGGAARACAVAVHDGIAVGINHRGDVDVGETTWSGEGALVARFTPSRAFEWAAAVRSEDVSCRDLTFHQDGRLTIAGQFNVQTEIQGSDGGTQVLDSAAYEDGFVAHFDSDGGLAWARRVGGPGSRDDVTRVFAPTVTTLLVSGQYEDTLTFGDGEPVLESAFSNGDAFFSRLTIAR